MHIPRKRVFIWGCLKTNKISNNTDLTNYMYIYGLGSRRHVKTLGIELRIAYDTDQIKKCLKMYNTFSSAYPGNIN